MDNKQAVEAILAILGSFSGPQEKAEAVVAAFQADPLAHVKPKPLEWVNQIAHSKEGTSANTGIGIYFAYRDYGGIRLSLQGVTIRYYPTLEAAQAAAYDDLCKRVGGLF